MHLFMHLGICLAIQTTNSLMFTDHVFFISNILAPSTCFWIHWYDFSCDLRHDYRGGEKFTEKFRIYEET